jgi:hypothetical protein
VVVLAAYLCGAATLVAIRLGWYVLELRRELDTHIGLLEELLELGDEF